MSVKIIAWCLYDFANSSFATIIGTFSFSLFFKEVLVGGSRGNFYWGLLQAVSYLAAALISIFIGAYADRKEAHKRYFIAFSMLSIIATGFLFFLNVGEAWKGSILYLLAFIGFSVANIFYNGFLLSITQKSHYGRISGAGWGIGYLGGLACLLLFRPWMNDEGIRTTFLLTAAFFLIFALPSFIMMKQEKTAHSNGSHPTNVAASFLKCFRDPNLCRFLISFFFYNEALATVISYASLFAHDVYHMNITAISTYLIMLQVTSFIGAGASGFLVDRIGSKKTILIFNLTWMIAIIGVYISSQPVWFWIISLFMGLGLGTIQSASRTFMALSISPEEQGSMMSFFSIATKISSFLGPLLFGGICYWTLNPKNAILSLLLFLLVGFILLLPVKDPKFHCRGEPNMG